MGYSVLIVDDHELFSTALRMALRGRGIDAHQIVPDSHHAIVCRAHELPAGLVVLDLDLGLGADGRALRGSRAVAPLRTAGWDVLIVSGSHPDQPATAAAIAAGAIGAVPMTATFDTLLRTVLQAATGTPIMTETERETWLGRDRGYRAQQRERARKLDRLSPRERQVLALLVEGQRPTAIAARFTVSMTTVRTHIRSMLTKLEVNSQLEAVALAAQAQGVI